MCVKEKRGGVRGFMNDTEKEVVWCINSSVSLIPLFAVSRSLLTHTQAQSEHSGVFSCDGLFYSRGNMKHPEVFVGGQLHDLALHLCARVRSAPL